MGGQDNRAHRAISAYDSAPASAAKLIIRYTHPPVAAILLAPANGTLTNNTQPTFVWSTAIHPDATTVEYSVQVDNNSDFTSPEWETPFGTATTATPGSALVLGTYYWRVISKDNLLSQTTTSAFTLSIGSIPSAEFSGTPLSGYGPLTVDFTDASSNSPTSWAWDFGDGGSSSDQNPQHIYGIVSAPATYTVQLVASNEFGTSTIIKTDYVTVTEPAPSTGFNVSADSGYSPLTVDFTLTGNGSGESYEWVFGDGGTSTDPNPQHIYTTGSTPTTYTSMLITTNAFGITTVTKDIYVTKPAPIASFDASPLSGYGPLTVDFTDSSSGDPVSWAWDFGDGGSSSDQNTQHIYGTVAAPTSYSVRLIVSSGFGEGTSYQTINVTEPSPDASFNVSADSGYSPMTVDFTITSPGSGETYEWIFGDGATGTETAPQHIYTTASGPTTYTAWLISTNAYGVSSSSKDIYVTKPAPVASFSGTPTSGYGEFTVQFTDTSEGNPTSWSWEFGDSASSNEQNPEYMYGVVTTPTKYTVRLIVSNAFGESTSEQIDYISVSEPAPTAGFSATPTSGNGPLTVDFTNESIYGDYSKRKLSATDADVTFAWDFGDGNSSSDVNPQHIYGIVSAPTTYTVTLIATTPFGVSTATKESYISVTEPAPTAGFSATPTSGNGPLTVDFTNESVYSPDKLKLAGSDIEVTFAWDFGDGNTSSDVNPQHIYGIVSAPTTYTVTLIATTPFGVSTATKESYISVTEPAPTAGFSATPTSGNGPLTVDFTNESVYSPDKLKLAGSDIEVTFAWDFGDGNTSSDVNPQHIYGIVSAPTTYTVTLIATTPFGVSTATKESYISVTEPAPTAGFSATPTSGNGPLTVDFTNESVYSPDKLKLAGSDIEVTFAWDFGDGNSSSDVNPQHIYGIVSAPTTYTVTLIATTPFGVSTATKESYISVTEPAPTAGFSATPTSGNGPLTVDFTNESVYSPDKLKLAGSDIEVTFAWDFGDGNTSSDVNPQHIYGIVSAPTTYTVTLIATTPFGVSTATKESYISVTEPAPTAGFSATPTSGNGPLTVDFTNESVYSPDKLKLAGSDIEVTFAWDFGDGNSSSDVNPQHIYGIVSAPTTYTVTLIATTPFGVSTATKESYISVTEPAPTAGFSATPTSGNGPLTVDFTNESVYSPDKLKLANGAVDVTFAWDFGDGNTSSDVNPQHIYGIVSAPTTYTVTLIATTPFGVSTATKESYISVTEPAPTADFSATPTSGFGALTVDFTNNSIYSPDMLKLAKSDVEVTFAWDFGDGNSSSDVNPQHIYGIVSAPTTYTVTLIATTPFGVSTATKESYISVTEPAPTADFSATPTSGFGALTVDFTNASSDGINKSKISIIDFAWNFGDGGSSSEMNPQHIYGVVSAPTTYTVTLIATTPFGVSTATKENYISVSEPAPVASFSGTPLSGFGPLTTDFTDSSEGSPTAWAWSFGDGGSSSDQNPQHVYGTVSAPTSYTVRLIVTSPFGESTSEQVNYVSVTEPAPTAEFSGTPTSGFGALTVNFTNASLGVTDVDKSRTAPPPPPTTPTWVWSFGDGGSSNSLNPQHIYGVVSAPTTYTVRLIVTTPFGVSTATKENYISVSEPAPVASFSGTPLSGFGPLTTDFTDSSEGSPTAWAWSFGDGGSSSDQNPQHVYGTVAVPTSYTVQLIVTSPFGESTSVQENYVSISQAGPVAEFSGTPTSGYGELTVDFTNESIYGPDKKKLVDVAPSVTWAWEFGDGGTSTDMDPQHIYGVVSAPTTYTVTLIATTPFGISTVTKENYISVTEPAPVADFTVDTSVGAGSLTVTFTDGSLNSPTSWEWTFGDGSTSTDQNPVHTYAEVTEAMYYEVQLIVTNAFGSDTMTKGEFIHLEPQLYAGFYAEETIGISPFIAYFNDTSVNNPTSWAWDFGDGNTSSDQNPAHTYGLVSDATSYTVSLVVSNDYSQSSVVYENYIQILPYSLKSAQLPSLKLFMDVDSKKSVQQWLPDAFPLERYMLVGQSASYDQVINFLELSSISGTTVSQDGYSFATTGMNVYRGIAGSTMTFASNLVKYSTYKIRKLPRLGMNVGDVVDINMGDYTFSTFGRALAESYGNAASIENPDSSKIAAEWVNSSTLRVTALSELTSGPTFVNVIASPVSPVNPTKRAARFVFGADQDKEYLWIYPNKLTLGYFTTAEDISKLYLKRIEDRSELASASYEEEYTDAAGVTEKDVLKFSLSSAGFSAVNGTPSFFSHVSGEANKWYVARMRVCADDPENDIESDIACYRGVVWADSHIDLSGNIFYGTPTVWTWQESALYSHNTGNVYPQFRFKTWNTAGNVYLKELQILEAVPQLLSMPRSDTREHYTYGNFSTLELLDQGWATTERWYGAPLFPYIDVVDGEFQMDFSGDTSILKGMKLTAKDNSPLYTPANEINRQVGIRIDARTVSGTFNQYGDLLYVAVYGVPESGMFNFRNPPGQIIATGEFGFITDGPHYAIGEGRNPYHQVQFCSKSSADAVLGIKDVDFLRDADDPNFGDWTLYPWQVVIPNK